MSASIDPATQDKETVESRKAKVEDLWKDREVAQHNENRLNGLMDEVEGRKS